MTRPLRVALVHHGATLGGAPVSLLHFLEPLLALGGVEPVLFVAHEAMRPFFAARLGIEVRSLPDPATGLGKTEMWGVSWLMPAARAQARRWGREFERTVEAQRPALRAAAPDLVHLSSSTLITTAEAARRENLPLVWQIRETFHGSRRGARARRMRARLAAAAAVLVPSASEIRSLGLEGDPRVHANRHPVRIPAAPPSRADARRSLGLPAGDRILLGTGGVSHWKGTLECLRMLDHLPATTSLVLLGPRPPPPRAAGPLARAGWRLENALVRLGLEDHAVWRYADRVAAELAAHPGRRVTFTGHQEDVTPWFAAADAVVYAAAGAHYPRGIHDAWAAVRPVVSTRVEGVTDCVEDGVDALLAPRRDPAGLARAAGRLLGDSALAERLARAGRARVEREADPARIAASIAGIYRNVLRTP